MLCILYVIVITSALGAAAFLAERAMPARWPRRGLWCVVIALSLIVPPLFKAQHAVTVNALLTTAQIESAPFTRTIYQLWILLSILLLAWAATHALRTRRALGHSTAARSIDGVPVLIADGIGPATIGVWRPRIVIPRWVTALPFPQRRYVMRHEQEHQRARDGLLLVFSAIALVLTPWNVPLYWVLRRLRLALELDCDQRVVAALGSPLDYATVLLDVSAAAARHPATRPALLGATHSLEERLLTLVSPARSGLASRVAGPVLAALLLIAALLMPHPVTSAHSASRDHADAAAAAVAAAAETSAPSSR